MACKKALSPQGKYVSIDDGDLKLNSKRLSIKKNLLIPDILSRYMTDVINWMKSLRHIDMLKRDTKKVELQLL